MKQKFSDNVMHDVLVVFTGFLLALPLFMIAHKRLPDPDWPLHADRILLFACILGLLVLFLRLFRLLISIGLILLFLWLGYGSVSGHYGFENIFKDYRALLYTIHQDPNPERLLFADSRQVNQQKEILAAVHADNPAVRKFAIQSTNEFFRSEQQRNQPYRNLIQCFAIFKKINRSWNYVNDPESREYFAPAEESVSLLAGDCDDHSILMASAIKSIGGTTRLIITTGHIYPELLVGNKADLEHVNYLVKKVLFPTESRGQDVHYHQDPDGRIWINLDYTAHYPGGRFMAEPVLGILMP